jgi:hypothetical protein
LMIVGCFSFAMVSRVGSRQVVPALGSQSRSRIRLRAP